jgi:hypothetical protein
MPFAWEKGQDAVQESLKRLRRHTIGPSECIRVRSVVRAVYSLSTRARVVNQRLPEAFSSLLNAEKEKTKQEKKKGANDR